MVQPRSTNPVPVVLTVLIVAVAVVIGFRIALSPRLADAPGPRSPPDEEALPAPEAPPKVVKRPVSAEEAYFAKARRQMVEQDLRGRDITDSKVLEVMGRVAREQFVPPDLHSNAYADRPLPIGHGQTISQPYIVALMTQLVRPNSRSRALDIGTGSGYQAAVLAGLCKEVHSIEILKPLADDAATRLKELGYKNVRVRCGDGYRGWPEHAPFDVIVVAAAPDHVPQPLVDQLAPGGRMVIPVGPYFQQELVLVEKQKDGSVRQRTITGVGFVPMTGEAAKKD